MNVQVQNFSSATTIPAMLVPGNDEMLALIREYRAREEAYSNAPLDISREEEDRLGQASNVPFFKLRDATPAVTSLAGAIAAVELAYEAEVKDGEDFCGGGFGPSLLKAALEYLKTPPTTAPTQADPVVDLVKQRFAEERLMNGTDSEEAVQAAYNRAVAVDQQLMTARPCSQQGGIAALERIQYEFSTFFDDSLDGSKVILNLLDGALGVFRAPALAPIAAATDPVFAAIEEFKAAAAAYEVAPDEPDEEAIRTWSVRTEKFSALAATIPTTVEGMRQQLQVLRDDEEGCCVDNESQFVAALLNIANHQIGGGLTLPK